MILKSAIYGRMLCIFMSSFLKLILPSIQLYLAPSFDDVSIWVEEQRRRFLPPSGLQSSHLLLNDLKYLRPVKQRIYIQLSAVINEVSYYISISLQQGYF